MRYSADIDHVQVTSTGNTVAGGKLYYDLDMTVPQVIQLHNNLQRDKLCDLRR